MRLRLFLDRAASVVFSLGSDVGRVSFFCRSEPSKRDSLAVDSDSRLPAATRIKTCADQSFSSHCLAHVLQICAARNIPQIGKAVIRLFAIDVVNVLPRLLPSHIQPGQSMSVMLRSINANRHVSRCVDNACNSSGAGTPAKSKSPPKHAGIGFVLKNLAQTLRGKIGLSHEALQLLIGQRPASVSSTVRASLF